MLVIGFVSQFYSVEPASSIHCWAKTVGNSSKYAENQDYMLHIITIIKKTKVFSVFVLITWIYDNTHSQTLFTNGFANAKLLREIIT